MSLWELQALSYFWVLRRPFPAFLKPCCLRHLVSKHCDKPQIIFDVICARLLQVMRVTGTCLLLDPLHIIGPHQYIEIVNKILFRDTEAGRLGRQFGRLMARREDGAILP